MPTPLTPAQQELLACAARLVVEDGFGYGQAKRQALAQLGLPARTPLPNNDALEDAVTEYIHIFVPTHNRRNLINYAKLHLNGCS